MSRENVEIVREMWEAYSDRGIDASLDYFTEDCVSEDFPELPDRTTYEGRKGSRDRYQRFAEMWGDFVIHPVEFIDVGNGVVVVVCEMRGSGGGSGAPMEAPIALVYEMCEGKIVRDRPFTSRSEALKAVGLSE